MCYVSKLNLPSTITDDEKLGQPVNGRTQAE